MKYTYKLTTIIEGFLASVCDYCAIMFLGGNNQYDRWKNKKRELEYWKARKLEEGTLSNSHYKHFYTTHFDLHESYYSNKVILDIGCGPRGSLEWASMTSRRVGLDPLVKEYDKLGIKNHKMEYIDSPVENIAMKDAECDVVCSFNSLDQALDLNKAIEEIKRVTRPGGHFLLIVEVNNAPSIYYPNKLNPEIIDLFKPEFTCETLSVYKPVAAGIYNAILANDKVAFPSETNEYGYMSARFLRN